MAELSITARPRSVWGKKVARLRRAGITPANIYGHRVPSTAIELNTQELERLVRRAGRTALVNLRVEGEPEPRAVLVREVQRKPTTDQLLHVDFLQVSMEEPIRVVVPLVAVGHAPVLDTVECVVVENLASVEVECLPRDIPQQITVDMSVLTSTESSIHVRDLTPPPGVTILTDPDVVLFSVTLKGVAAEEAAAEAEAVPAPEEVPVAREERKEEEEE
jgi:large subunit ribosomal protein L25